MPEFQTDFDPAYGRLVPVAAHIGRVTANNPSAFTFAGTNSYVAGRDGCFVVDPGPDDDAHLDALVAAIAGRPVEAILLTHTHRDHTGLVRRL
ncbi:MAG: MBL fold metallo-hydrolase, partial [Aurantimonas coralicida]